MLWLLLALIFLTAAVNIRSFYLIRTLRLEREQWKEETAAAKEGMAAFLSSVEAENEEFYQKLLSVAERSAPEATEEKEPVKVPPAPIELAVQPAAKQARVERVELLYKQGFSTPQIVKIANVKQGEAELIINLFRQKRAAGSEVS